MASLVFELGRLRAVLARFLFLFSCGTVLPFMLGGALRRTIMCGPGLNLTGLRFCRVLNMIARAARVFGLGPERLPPWGARTGLRCRERERFRPYALDVNGRLPRLGMRERLRLLGR
jgi:hypothetical protein